MCVCVSVCWEAYELVEWAKVKVKAAFIHMFVYVMLKSEPAKREKNIV